MKLRQYAVIFAVGVFGGLIGVVIAGQTGLAQASSDDVVEVLNVKRINIVEDNGNYALVLANSEKLPGSILNGEERGSRRGIPGIIFYNNFGDEIGGLIYPAQNQEGEYSGGVQLSMDQIKQTGQAIALRHWRQGDYVRSNLEITDYSTEKFAGDVYKDPDIKKVLEKLDNTEDELEQERIFFKEYLPMLGEKGYLAHRIFLGSEGAEQRRAMLEIKDSRSRPRIRLLVDEDDQPRIEILDEEGDVVHSFPDVAKVKR